VCGAATTAALLARARGAGARVVTTYGMSETCGGCVYDGRPLSGVRARVGGDGRIRVRGPVVFSGYRLRPALTAATLVDGEVVTGDLGHVDADGRLAVLGRTDEVVVTGGENVALAAVEAALAEHPAVREAAALGVADPEWGQRLVAVVVPFGDMPALAELRDWVAARAGRAAAPREVLAADTLPLRGPGKVDRAALAEWAARGP
jgi:o-succinylbenzoate---CoA ligase